MRFVKAARLFKREALCECEHPVSEHHFRFLQDVGSCYNYNNCKCSEYQVMTNLRFLKLVEQNNLRKKK